MVLGDVILFGIFRPSTADIHNQGILNPKDGIGGFVGVISEVKGSFVLSASLPTAPAGRKARERNIRDQMIIPPLLKHKMHMRRPKRMPMQPLQQLPNRPIMRNRIWHGRNRMKPENPILPTPHHTPTIRRIPPGILHVVVPRGIRLPDIDLDVGDGVPVRVAQRAYYE